VAGSKGRPPFLKRGAMNKRLVFTVTSENPIYQRLAIDTHPAMAAYAEKCNADFEILTVPKEKGEVCCWDKYQTPKFLRKYERVLYVDTDIFICPDAGDIFDEVPVDKFGGYDEIPFSGESLKRVYSQYLAVLGFTHAERLGMEIKKYFNAGMFLASRGHEHAFLLPAVHGAFENNMELFKEQSLLNFNLQKFCIPMHDVGVKFNAFLGHEQDGKICGYPFDQCKFIHLAGMFHNPKNSESDNVRIADEAMKLLKSRTEKKGVKI
jgi:lipopolysaccharide biosynthesis glycosyltransferase